MATQELKRKPGRPRKVKPEVLPEHDLGLVFGFFGWKGAGKSLSKTKLIYEEFYKGDKHLLNDGTRGPLKVYHNGGLRFGERFDIRKFVKMEYENCIIDIDEFHIYGNPRRAMSFLNVVMSDSFLQLRKANVNIAIATHHAGRVDAAMREQIDFHIECKRPDEPELQGKVCYQEWSDPFGHFGPPGEVVVPVVSWGLDEYWSLYDSYGLFYLDNAYDKKQEERERKAERVKEIIGACRVLSDNGYEEVRAQDIVEVMWQNGLTDVEATGIGIALRNMGHDTYRKNGGRFYNLSEITGKGHLATSERHTGTLLDSYENGNSYDVDVQTGEIKSPQIAPKLPTIQSEKIEKLAYATIRENYSYRVVLTSWQNQGYEQELLDSMIARRGMTVVKEGRDMILKKAS